MANPSRKLVSLLPILCLLSLSICHALPSPAAALPGFRVGLAEGPHARSPNDPKSPSHPRRSTGKMSQRGTNDVASAVTGTFSAVPAGSFVPNAFLSTGQSVSLLDLTPNPSISCASYHQLTRQLPTVLTKAIESSTHSWEIGTVVEALLEVYVPKLTPFAYDADAFDGDIPWAAFWVIEAALSSYDWTGSPGGVDPKTAADLAEYLDWDSPTPLTPKPLIDGDGALGDPVSLASGVWLLARFATRDDVKSGLTSGVSAAQYAWAVGNQMQYLYSGVKSFNGTISQREGSFQVWSDMGFMIPPSPAYIGLDTANHGLLSFALEQWSLESSALLDYDQNLFRHVNDFDPNFWATGAGWMLAGITRVLASIDAAGQTWAMASSIDPILPQLANTFGALFAQLTDDNLVPNYQLNSNSTLSTGDAAGTAVIVAAYYRFLHLFPSSVWPSLTESAEKAFDGTVAKLDKDGWLTQVVNPLGPWVVDGSRSPEGQSFVGMMWAARTLAGV